MDKDNRGLRYKIKDSIWRKKYIGLLTTEFYFFHNGALPKFFVFIRMTRLSTLLNESVHMQASFEFFVKRSSGRSVEMYTFYREIRKISRLPYTNDRYEAVEKLVYGWTDRNIENEAWIPENSLQAHSDLNV